MNHSLTQEYSFVLVLCSILFSLTYARGKEEKKRSRRGKREREKTRERVKTKRIAINVTYKCRSKKACC